MSLAETCTGTHGISAFWGVLLGADYRILWPLMSHSSFLFIAVSLSAFCMHKRHLWLSLKPFLSQSCGRVFILYHLYLVWVLSADCIINYP